MSKAHDPAPVFAEVVNALCPRSGKPVAKDSLCVYRSETVGFCNPGCRDDFVAGGATRAKDEAFFDAAIAKSK